MADYKYTMKDMSKLIDRTTARIYDYFKEDREFYLSKSHRKKDSKKGYLYDDAVLERLKNRLVKENSDPTQDLGNEAEENPKYTPPQLAALKEELEEMKGKYAALQSDYEKAESERVELMRQNGLKTEEINRLLLMLQEEKQEKAQIMLMLPQPRQTIMQRLRGLFKRANKE